MKKLLRNFSFSLFIILLFYLPSLAQNVAPVLDTIGAQSVNEGQVLTFRLHATDANGDSIILSANNIPTNASFTDSGNGAGSFTFSPDYNQAAVYNVTFFARDTLGGVDSEIVAITVNNVNLPPVLESIGPQSVNEGSNLTFRIHATDTDGDLITLTATNTPTNSSFADSGNGAGSFTFNPTYAQSGTYNVTFKATDPSLAVDSEVVAITVNNVNLVPVLDAIGPQSVNEGANLTFRIHATDTDGDLITLTATNAPTNSSFADSGNGAGSFTFNPTYAQSGTYNVTFKATDPSLAVDSEVVVITVNNVNLTPVLDPIGPQSVNEGSNLTFRIHATDADGDLITLTATNAPTNSSFADSGNGAGSFTFNPTYAQSGTYNVTFKATDPSLAVDSEVVAITVNNVNLTPVLDPIGPQSVNEGSNLTFRIHATDTDGDLITLTATNTPTNSSFADSGNGAGSFTFNPSYAQSGTYNVTFKATDPSLAVDSEVVAITVNNVNLVPVLDAIGPQSVNEGSNLTFRIHATDTDGDLITLTATNTPTNSSFADSGNGAGSFTFNPTYAQSGTYNVTFKVTDPSLAADSEIVAITVTNLNNPPVLDPIGPRSVTEGQVLSFRVHATDINGDRLILSSLSVPTNASFTDSTDGAGSFVFSPNFTQAGVYNVTFIATDTVGAADSEIVAITVTSAGNQTPVLDSIGSKSINEGSNLTFRVHATDADLDLLTLTATNVPLNATFTDSGNGSGSFSFNPSYIQAGTYNVTFKATDPSLAADSEVVIITVNNINNAPILDPIGPRSVTEGQVLTFRVHATDINGDRLILSALNVPTNTTFTDSTNGSGSFRFSPSYTQSGIYNVTFITTDTVGAADSEIVAITVTNVNNPPVLDSIGPKSINEGQVLTFRLHATDVNGDRLIFSALNVPTNATLTDSGNGSGSFRFSPNYTQSGIYNVTFITTDTVGAADSEIVAVTVTNVNNPPVLDSIGPKSVNEGQVLTFRVHGTDINGDRLVLSALNVPTNATFTDSTNGAGSFRFSPSYIQAGIYNVTFITTDTVGAADSELVAITVTNVNNAPVLDPIGPRSVTEGQVLSFRVHGTDINGDRLVLSALNVPTNATFTDSTNGAGSFAFSPSFTQAGVYNVTFISTDTVGSADSELVPITVISAGNQPPVLDSIGPKSVNEAQVLTFRVHATDPDLDPLVLSATGLPVNAVFSDSGNGAGAFRFSPTYAQAGVYHVTFKATDVWSAVDSEVVTITVNNVNNPPVLDSIGPKSVNEGQVLTFRIHATDINGDRLLFSALNVPTNATLTDSGNGSGSFRFSPSYTQAGIYNVTFIVADTVGAADTEVVAITVNNVNNVPTLDPIGPRSVTEGQVLSFRVHGTDINGDRLVLSALNVPTNATFTDSTNGAGSFSFSPSYIQSGAYNVTFIVADTVGAADSEVVAITVNNANNPPVLDSIGPKSVNEGQVLTFRLHATDINGDRLLFNALNVPANATLSDSGNGSGSFSFSPGYTQSGIYNVTFVTTDTVGAADSEVVAITVNNVNNPPVLDSIGPKIVTEGQILTFRIHSTDINGDRLILSALNVPANATFTDSTNGAGSFRFAPNFVQAGIYNVTFISTDTVGAADSEIVAITVVNAGNQAPVLDSIGPRSVNEGSNLTFRIHATDPDLDPLVLTATSLPVNATFSDSGNGAGSFTFNPSYIQSGIYHVTFKATDPSLAVDSEVVTITVNNLNNPPVLDSIGPKSVTEGQVLSFRVHATDINGDRLILSALNVPTNGTFTDSTNGAGSFRFAPNFTQAGVYNVTFIATDTVGTADSEIVAITVTSAGNQTPVLDSIGPKSVNEGQVLTFRVHATDADLDPLTLTATNLPLNATFTDSANGSGSFRFSPGYIQAGTYNVTFKATDPSLAADSEIVTITVNNVNNPPVLDSIGPKIVTEGQILTFRVHATDINGDRLILSALNVPTNATFTDSTNGAGSFRFAPNFVQAGIYNVTFISTDTVGAADSEIVAITVVNAGNQAPVLDSIGPRSVNEGSNLTFRIHATDPDLDPLVLTATSLPVNATFSDSGNGAGSFTFNPSYIQSGIYHVTFKATDPSLAVDSEVVTITVNNLNNPPVLDSIGPKSVNEAQVLTIRVHATDVNGDRLILSALNVPSNTVLADSGNGAGSFVFNPSYAQAGIYNVTFIARDTTGAADSEVVQITVNNVSQPPVLATIGPRDVMQRDTLLFRVSATDPDGTIPTLTALNVPANSNFVDSANGAGSFRFLPDTTQLGIYNVTFIASDGSLADSEIVQITVIQFGNRPPVIDSIGPRSVREGDSLRITVQATDRNGDPIVLGASNAPLNSSFTDNQNGTGLFIFRPSYYQAGVYTVTFVASDNANPPLSDFENVVITVVDVNRPPAIDSIPPRNVAVGDTLRIRVVGTDSTDSNGGPLYMTATNLPLNSTFSDSGGGIGKFRFVPASSQIGVHTVTFMCTDAEVPALTGVRNVTINVTSGANKPPILNPIGWKTVREADTLTFNVSASDPDGTIPILYTSTLPRNASFVDSGNGRGTFTFRPDYAQQGLKQITFYASDGSLVDYENVLIQIVDAGNQRPILRSIPPDSVMEGDSLKILVHADDPDSTIPHLSAGTLPISASFTDSGNGNGVFTFKPVYVQSGVYGIIFIASDGSLADTESVLITVLEAGNQRPILSVPYDSILTREDSTINFTVTGTDPDSIPPILRATNLPTNATFNQTITGTRRTGAFSFTPGYTQAGTYLVYFQVVDSLDNGLTATDSVIIVVRNVNQAPHFTRRISNRIINEGTTMVDSVIAVDDDGPIPILRMTSVVNNATFLDRGNGTGVFTFTPYFNQSNQIPGYSISFIAIDSEDTTVRGDYQQATVISVTDVPMPPVIAPINDTSVVEGHTLRILVQTSDPDSIPPSLTILNRPTNSSFIAGGYIGTFTFNPSYTQSGIYNVGFVARDGTALADTELVTITVIEAGNQRPVLTHIPDTIAVVSGTAKRDTLLLNVRATDPDGNKPHLYAQNLPANATFFDSANGSSRFIFTPDSTQRDSVYHVLFIASDDTLSDSLTVAITVKWYVRGDANGDGKVTIADVVFTIAYLFKGGPAPYPRQSGDANHDKKITVADCVYLINFLFKGGPPP